MRPRIEIPRGLMEQAARRGRTLGDIQRDMRRLGVEVSLTTIWERLGEAGIRLATQYDPWTPAKAAARASARKAECCAPRGGYAWGSTVVRRRQAADARCLGPAVPVDKWCAQVTALEASELAARDAMVKAARAGDLEARLALVRRLGCRVSTAAECAAETVRRAERQGSPCAS